MELKKVIFVHPEGGGKRVWGLLGLIAGMLAVLLVTTLALEAIRSVPALIAWVFRSIFDLIFSRGHTRDEPVPKRAGTAASAMLAPMAHLPHLPYERKLYLLTIAEKQFFNMLSETVPDDIYICPQVCLGGVLDVTAREREYWSYWNRIQAKRIDFLLCDKDTLTPLLAVELDDSSHDSPDRIERDNFVDDVCKSAGLAILHFRVHKYYDRLEIGHVLQGAIREARLALRAGGTSPFAAQRS